MQSYREEAGSRPPVSQLDPLPAPSGRDDMSTYRARYEEAMNPFEAFRGRVSVFVSKYFGEPGNPVFFGISKKINKFRGMNLTQTRSLLHFSGSL